MATQDLDESRFLQDKPTSPESLIRYNGELIEALLNSVPWKIIAMPVLKELIASVSGRFTNGRFYHGSLTRDMTQQNTLFVSGYQKGLMDFYNHLHDFIVEKDKLRERKKLESLEKKETFYNPFLEE